jgi:glycosyltransferase involved in cell wall biosynthesis
VLYIAIPAHNEASTVGVLLWKIRKVMADFGRDYSILVLDDASTDGTEQVLERYRKVLPLRVTRSEKRLGYARAMERLFREAVAEAPYPKRDAVIVLQGDFSEDPAGIIPLVKSLEGGADVVAGVPAPQAEGEPPVSRPRAVRLTRWAANWLLRGVLQGSPVSDPFTGFRAYRVIVLKKALRELDEGSLVQSQGWGANLELLGVVAPHARRIEEMPVEFRDHLRVRESRFRMVPTLQGLFRLRGNPHLRQFSSVGGGVEAS